MRTDKINYTCSDCGETAIFTSYVKARAGGWALSRDYKTCYCPACAPLHRLGGAKGKSTKNPGQWLPKGFEQLKLDVK